MNPIALPISDITVLEDRAQVLRRGRVILAAGANRLSVSGLAPVLADKTLVGGSPAAGIRIADVRVRRERVERARLPAELAEVSEGIRRIERSLEILEHEEQSLDSVDEQLAALRSQLLAEAVVDTAWNRAAPAFWQERLREIETREDAGSQARTRIAAERVKLEREAADLGRRRDLLATPDTAVNCTAEILVEAASAGEAEITLAYVVPNACWRPCYVARLLDGQMHLDAEACVWQRTGEDWRGVRLRLSTERLDLGSEPPRLTADLLRLQPKSQQVVIEERDREREDTGGTAGAPAAELPGVDDGGETRLLAAPGAHDLAGDGLPHRVPLFGFTVPAKIRLVVRSELAQAAILASVQANAAAQPLLAGPVELVRDGGAAGRTALLFTAPGAEFELGWGAEAELRVHRDDWKRDEEPGMLGNWRTSHRTTRVGIANLGAQAHTVEIEERIPVSELAQVKVELDADETTPRISPEGEGIVRTDLASGRKINPATPNAPDADGILRWTKTVPPRGHADICLMWRLRTQESVKQG